MEINLMNINFSVSLKRNENLPPWYLPFSPFLENNFSKCFEKASNYHCLKQNTPDFWLFFLNVTTKILINVLSFGQLSNILSGKLCRGNIFDEEK